MNTTSDLFSEPAQPLRPGLTHFPGRAQSALLLEPLPALLAASPLRHLELPRGGRMSVAMSNCGSLGWVSDARGYRYQRVDPLTGQPWPALPAGWTELAQAVAAEAGFAGFDPDVCLINGYGPGASLGLHRDADEADARHPIVSISIGASAQFLWGGLQRSERVSRLTLHDGDVLVWGGPARLSYHGVAPLRGAPPSTLAPWNLLRLNLTFRRAGSYSNP